MLVACQKETSFELGNTPGEGSLQSDVTGDCFPSSLLTVRLTSSFNSLQYVEFYSDHFSRPLDSTYNQVIFRRLWQLESSLEEGLARLVVCLLYQNLVLLSSANTENRTPTQNLASSHAAITPYSQYSPKPGSRTQLKFVISEPRTTSSTLRMVECKIRMDLSPPILLRVPQPMSGK